MSPPNDPRGSPSFGPPVPPTPPASASLYAGYDVTRYLCAAMYTDVTLARSAVDRIIKEPRRAVASSPGVSMGCVLRHAVAARRRQRRRDVLLSFLAVAWLVALLVAFAMGRGLGYTVAIAGFLVAWAVVATELVSVHYGVVSHQLKRENFDPHQAPRPSNPKDAARVDTIELRDRGNVLTSSFFPPFVGHGDTYSTWSFALNTARAEQGKEILPFTVHELNQHLSARVRALGLPGLDVAEVLLVNGSDLLLGVDDRTRGELLPHDAGPPAAHVSEVLLRGLREDGRGRARPYLAVRVAGWGGELVSTLFLRCTVLPDRSIAFIEGSNCLLTPVRAEYRTVDTLLHSPTTRQWCRLVGEAGLRTPYLTLRAPFAVLGDLFAPISEGREQRRQERRIRLRSFNYGAEFSLREAASSGLYYRYFQELDGELYSKTVEHRVLDALVQFMEGHNIDTGELIQRQTTIYNSGLFAGRDISINRSSVRAGGGTSGKTARPGRPAQSAQRR
ncbi:hypothetical protein ACF068_06970 [Streptomyces sp. NPDC016309]|uniref:hypothetical protein n=1 Tax=Streptomyces sp. NPDC016309 TaxID=3364965 RepID=UPI003702E970